MARYIDADALKEQLEDFSKWCRDGRKQGVDFVLDCVLPNIVTADVAPRSEVAREIFGEIEAEIVAALESNYHVKSERMKKPRLEMTDEFIAHIEGKINALCGMEWFIAELKQKYTEEQK